MAAFLLLLALILLPARGQRSLLRLLPRSRGEAARHPSHRSYGCATCHTIPGVPSASGSVGPPLTRIGKRTYLAGRVTNTPENMVRWIMHPHSIDDRTATPEMNVTKSDARVIARYLIFLN